MRMVNLSRAPGFSIGSESRLGGGRDCWNGGTDVSDFEWDTDPDHDNDFTEVEAVDLENKKEAGGDAGLFLRPLTSQAFTNTSRLETIRIDA